MWSFRRTEPVLDREIVHVIIWMLMRIDAKVDRIMERLEIEDEEEEDDT